MVLIYIDLHLSCCYILVCHGMPSSEVWKPRTLACHCNCSWNAVRFCFVHNDLCSWFGNHACQEWNHVISAVIFLKQFTAWGLLLFWCSTVFALNNILPPILQTTCCWRSISRKELAAWWICSTMWPDVVAVVVASFFSILRSFKVDMVLKNLMSVCVAHRGQYILGITGKTSGVLAQASNEPASDKAGGESSMHMDAYGKSPTVCILWIPDCNHGNRTHGNCPVSMFVKGRWMYCAVFPNSITQIVSDSIR